LSRSNENKPKEDKEVSSTHFVLEKNLVRSKAFQSLNGTSIKIYLFFRLKCQFENQQTKKSKRSNWIIKNNGEIEFSYAEARAKDFSSTRFMKGIDKLIETGFIDLVHSGSGGQKGDKSKYAISNRWKKYGTPEFEKKTRPRDTRQGRGFASLWSDPEKRKELLAKQGKSSIFGIENDKPSIIENDKPSKVVPIMDYQKA
jgi:hypothetical protein